MQSSLKLFSLLFFTLIYTSLLYAQPEPEEYNEQSSEEIMNEASDKKSNSIKISNPLAKRDKNKSKANTNKFKLNGQKDKDSDLNTGVDQEQKTKEKKKINFSAKSPFKSGSKNTEMTDGLDLNEEVRIDVGSREGEGAEFGIVGKYAPEFNVGYWWDEDGNKSNYYLSDFRNKVLVIFCWADWCPACKSHGYDEMLAIQDKYLDNPEVELLAVQTVFEGKMQNSKSKVKKVRESYGFKMPMGHDEGDVNSEYRSSILMRYNTAGTPWFIVIDKKGKVIFNYHHLPIDATKEVIDSLLN